MEVARYWRLQKNTRNLVFYQCERCRKFLREENRACSCKIKKDDGLQLKQENNNPGNVSSEN